MLLRFQLQPKLLFFPFRFSSGKGQRTSLTLWNWKLESLCIFVLAFGMGLSCLRQLSYKTNIIESKFSFYTNVVLILNFFHVFTMVDPMLQFFFFLGLFLLLCLLRSVSLLIWGVLYSTLLRPSRNRP